ncbi:MAG: MiaB/RimO family radical SAM methylthiotransferase [Patescibacteria group bacterium]|nr:MiaB/RimO family radical SAM methylthiotransferase [Patescibacteria group bacterium]
MENQAKKYYLKTFGCQMNTADAERIAAWYEEQGWKPTKNITEADEVVIVSCSVRQSAENRVFGLINNLSKLKSQSSKVKAKAQNLKLSKQRIVLTGCMLRYPKSWLRKKLPAVDEFKKIDEYRVRVRVRGDQKMAFVPISNGCNNFCTYCVVPYARGREVSRPFAEIVCEVEELAKRGFKEITLLGQNVNSYGKDFDISKLKIQNPKLKLKTKKFQTHFATLLSTLHEIPGIEKISFLTSNPWDLSEEIIEAMNLPKMDRYLHLPVQSGDDEILKRMNRHYTAEDYAKLVKKIRAKIPDIKIGTDIIVGFPGETEEQFENTVDLAKKVGFEKAYVAMYSPREQTAAFKMKDDVPFIEKKRRWQILDKLINSNI